MPKPGYVVGRRKLAFTRLREVHGTSTAIPDTDTEIAHGLGVVPVEVTLVPKTTGAAGYGLLSARSTTSITIRGSVSGVDIDYPIVG